MENDELTLKKLLDLEQEVEDLKNELQNKNVIINALINQVKTEEVTNKNYLLNNCKRIKIIDERLKDFESKLIVPQIKSKERMELNSPIKETKQQQIELVVSKSCKSVASTILQNSQLIEDEKKQMKCENEKKQIKCENKKIQVKNSAKNKKNKNKKKLENASLKIKTSNLIALKKEETKISDEIIEMDCSESSFKMEEDADFIKEIHGIFQMKSKKTELKPNFNFQEFVNYAEISYEFNLNNKNIQIFKNPLKMYLESHTEKVMKYTMDNINHLSLNQICSTVFMMNSYIPYKQKTVIFHDLILLLRNHSKLPYIFSALFNNIDLPSDPFSNQIKKIVAHQIFIDSELFEEEVIQYLVIINTNFNLENETTNLWTSLKTFVINKSVFLQGQTIIDPETVENGFIVRMMCHYLDWDYTYKEIILKILCPSIEGNERSPIHVYYLGILAVNAFRLFKGDPSVLSLFKKLREYLLFKDESSIVSYLILKQIYTDEFVDWPMNNLKWIRKMELNVPILQEILLI